MEQENKIKRNNTFLTSKEKTRTQRNNQRKPQKGKTKPLGRKNTKD